MKELLGLAGVSNAVGATTDCILKMVERGEFPEPVAVASGFKFWDENEVHAWIEAPKQESPEVEADDQGWMPVVYVAGPYRAPTREGVELNIQAAKSVAARAAQKGYAVLCPHMNTAHMDLIVPVMTDAYWLTATKELMRRCDLVVLVPGYSESEGTRAEIEEAKRLGMDIFCCVDKLPDLFQVEADD